MLSMCAAVAFVVAILAVAAVGEDSIGSLSMQLQRERALSGSGRWGANQVAQAVAPQRWQMAIGNADGVLDGAVTIEGSSLMTTGRISGRMEGRGVWGTISDDDGRQVATFTGAVTEDGRVHGRYQDRSGEVGTWEWDNPLRPALQ